MSANVLTAEQALVSLGQGYCPVVAPLPYTSFAEHVADLVRLESGDWQGAVADRDILPSIPSLIVSRAAAAIACASTAEKPSFAVAGEHTYGPHHVSTTTLMERAIDAELAAMAPDKTASFAAEKPVDANTSTHQVEWLAGQSAARIEARRTLLVAFGQHIPRLQILANLYGLEADIVDAHDILKATGNTDAQIDEAVHLFDSENAAYERRALLATKYITKLGKRVTSFIFERLSRRQSPNVVDLEVSESGALSFIQMPASQFVRHQASRQI